MCMSDLFIIRIHSDDTFLVFIILKILTWPCKILLLTNLYECPAILIILGVMKSPKPGERMQPQSRAYSRERPSSHAHGHGRTHPELAEQHGNATKPKNTNVNISNCIY